MCVTGLWAAGNVVDPRAQVITSAGSGSAAAVVINADLVEEEVEREVERNNSALGVLTPSIARTASASS
jgi:hypothetical protein